MRRVLRFSMRWLAAGLLMSVGLMGGQALAGHQFSDIPNGHFFHSSISWLVDNGVATGYVNGTFRPNGNITRGQASFWFRNYNDASSEVQNKSVTVLAVAPSVTNDVTCPQGKRPTGGGGFSNKPYLHIAASHPIFNFGLGVWTGWRVTWNVVNGPAFPENASLTSYVLCAPQAS